MRVVAAIEKKSLADQANIDRHNKNESEIARLKEETADIKTALQNIDKKVDETGDYVKMLVDKMIPGAKIDERRAKE